MKKKPWSILISLLMLVLPLNSFSQTKNDVLKLELDSFDPGSTISVQGNAEYSKLTLKNALYQGKYSIRISREFLIQEPLVLDPGMFQKESGRSEAKAICTMLKIHIKKLQDYQAHPPADQNEKELAKRALLLQQALDTTTCRDKETIQKARYWLGTTERTYDLQIKVRSGDKVTVLVSRDTLTWTYILKGNEPGKWLTTYGFGFSSRLWEEDSYFSKAEPDTLSYRVLKSESKKFMDLRYIPVIFFNYFPARNLSKTWTHSLSGGLGFDLTAPSVFLGYAGIYRHNLGISLGLVFYEQYKLKPQYQEGVYISEYLEVDQLHDRIYRPNIYFAITFRFGRDPFQSVNIEP